MRLIVFIALMWAANASGATFFVEDDALTPVPVEVAAAIARYQKDMPTNFRNEMCKFIGKAVALSEGDRVVDWVITTADACSWAANAAPVWVLSKSSDSEYQVVLFHFTYDLTVGSGSQNALHHIATARATAARREEQLWKFDGKTYQLFKTKIQ